MVDFKRSHNLIDTKTYGQTYIASSAASTEEAKKLTAQKNMVEYLIDFIENNPDQMIPVGVANVSAEATNVINQYNMNMVQIEKYRSDGTLNNPAALEDVSLEDASLGAAFLVMAIVGGALMPPLQGMIIDCGTVMGHPAVNVSYALPLLCFIIVSIYGLRASSPMRAER